MFHGHPPARFIRSSHRTRGVSSVQVLLLVLFACAREDAPPGPSSTNGLPLVQEWVAADETAGAVNWAQCRPSAEPLRVDCALGSARPLVSRWQVEGVAVPVEAPEGNDHDVVLWGMGADDDVRWSVELLDDAGVVRGTASGRLSSPGAAGVWEIVRASVEGDASQVPPMLVRAGCPGAEGWMWLDATGKLRGVQAVDQDTKAVSFDGRDGVYAIVGRRQVEYRGLDGVLRWRSAAFDHPLHHDVHLADDGLVWVLFAEEVNGVVSDGLWVLDDTGREVARWHLADHVPTGEGRALSSYWTGAFPLTGDWSHGNSVHVRDGEALLSLRWLDAVVALDADPSSSRFGEVRWVAEGRDGELSADLSFDGEDGWVGQHHATRTSSGDLMVFDNRSFPKRSRVVQVAADLGAGTLDEVASWEMDTHCEVQGSAYELSTGDVLATCGPRARASLWRPGQDRSVWSMTLQCATAPHRVVPRFVPMEGVLSRQ